MGKPIKWKSYRLREKPEGAPDGLLVKGRLVGPHLGIHRMSPVLEKHVTGFTLTHLPTGKKIVCFSSEKYAVRFAEEMRAAFGDDELALLGTQAQTQSEKATKWGQLAKAADECDLWPLEILATSNEPFQICIEGGNA